MCVNRGPLELMSAMAGWRLIPLRRWLAPSDGVLKHLGAVSASYAPLLDLHGNNSS